MTVSELSIPLYHLELVRDRSIPFRKCGTVADAAQIFHEVLDRSPVEQFMIIHMDSCGTMVGAEKIAMGQLERVNVSMRDLFRGAVLSAVPRVILGHNHPSNNPTPSNEDIMLTEAAVRAGSLIQIEVWDHIVISPNGTHTSIFDYTQQKMLEKVQDMLGYPIPNPSTMAPQDLDRLTKEIKNLIGSKPIPF